MRVFLADDHPLFRIGLRIALDQETDIQLIGEASDGFSAVEKIQVDPPDVSLIDVDMPGISGIRVIRMLRKAYPQMKIIVLSTYDDKNYIHGAMQAGADGYVLKCVEVAELVRIIKSFFEGHQAVSPYLVNLSLDFKATVSTSGEVKKVEYPVLTHREKEILRSIIEGQSNKEISHTLYVSVETVKSHIKSIYHKLQVKNRVEAVTVAIKQNVLPQNGIHLN
ncbi:MAG: DNA-binding response regulator [Syntrophobacterales bacterium GWC2_56_13]|nr:MAG: DNA-binding response regulator [Syntrophobacterales bacterium GWC2_56_13]OHE21543.1 MAG: DNA-binding response regulator [Syntrophobacterales bacterium GWF2_56_9]